MASLLSGAAFREEDGVFSAFMGFRDDFEATAKRAESLEQDLAKANDELGSTQEQLEKRDTELDRLKARMRALGIADEDSSRPKKDSFQFGVGIVAIALGIAMLGFIGAIYAEWSSYIEEEHAALIALGRAAYVDLATFFDTADAVVDVSMSLVLCVIGVGTLFGHRWAAVASLMWGTVALTVNVFHALAIAALYGTISEDAAVGGVAFTVFPLFMFVYGIWAIRKLSKT